MRRVHRARGRSPHALLPDEGGFRRRPPPHHHRGARAERPAPPRPEGFCRGRRHAVRVLHARHDHGIGGAAPAQGGPGRARDRPRARRPHLPVRHLRPDRPRGAAGGRDDEGRGGVSGAPPPSGDRLTLEPERYELAEGPAYRFDVDRREFVKLLGGGLVVIVAASAAPAQESGARGGGAGSPPREIAAWLHVAADGTVTAYTGKVEFGQDIRAWLTQAVADELRAPLPSIRLVMGDTDLTPFDQGTFGSRTTPFMAAQLRQVAAAARETLLDLAVAKWSVDRSALDAREGEVVHAASGRALRFGELTQGQALVRTVAADPSPTPVPRWTVAGRSIPKVNAHDLVTGRHRYTSDLTRPGLWHGRVLRPPAIGATLVSLDTSGVDTKRVSVVHDGDFVGV